jgi:hypothetical protein
MCDQPIKLLQEEFKGSVGTSMGKILTNLIGVYSKLRTIPLIRFSLLFFFFFSKFIRKEGLLSISLKPEEMAKPVTDKVLIRTHLSLFHTFQLHYQAQLSYQMHCWISYGLLLCPEALGNPVALELCKMVCRICIRPR